MFSLTILFNFLGQISKLLQLGYFFLYAFNIGRRQLLDIFFNLFIIHPLIVVFFVFFNDEILE